ncbi:MAG: polysulfide reductase NrfD [Deltaproteobacteria bacterium]|nr:polysulfide reductase NrfD [Deltaproteobacteria bacterium]
MSAASFGPAGEAHGIAPHSDIPEPRRTWWLFAAISAAALGCGAFSYYNEEHFGTIVTGMRSPGYGGASWGLYIVFVVFFIGVSFAGITVAALARLFQIAVLKPVTRMAELLTLVALVAGAFCVLADLGRPLEGLQNLPRFANPSSPFFGTFTLVVSGYMFSSLVYFFLAGRADAAAAASKSKGPLRWFHLAWASGFKDEPAHRSRHHRVSFWLSLGILPMLITAHSTLGFVFGIQGGRPGWFGALQAPAFVMLAGVSGTGMLILLTLAFRWLYRLHDRIPDASIRWLGNFLWVLALVYLYFTVVEELTATYAAPEADRHMAHEIVGGQFALLFWITIGCLFVTFLIPFVLYVRDRTNVGLVAVAAVTANVAAVCKRFLIVVPSQTHGALVRLERGHYVPTWVEIGVVIGLLGLVFAVLLVFGRVFPLVPAPHGHEERVRPKAEALRRISSIATAVTAVGLIVFGLMDAFRLWSGGEVDNRVPFSPVIFLTGVMLLFISAVVFELVPERKKVTWEDRKQSLEVASFPWEDRTKKEAARALAGSGYRKLARLASMAETAVREGEGRRAIDLLLELQRQANASSLERGE